MTILKDNIQAAIILSDALASTLGPNGMNKLLVDNIGETYVTNNGSTIIDKIDLNHPIAKLMAEVAKTMKEEVGDGTTSGVILTGELLKKALKLIDQGLHPSNIIKGYQIAREDALKILDEIKFKGNTKDIISTCIRDQEITNLVLEAVKDVEVEDIIILKKKGNSSRVVKGLFIDKEPVHPRMPTEVKGKILITKTPLEVRNIETDAEIEFKNPGQLYNFLNQENQTLRKIVELIKNSGARAVLCQKGIDERAQEFLARAGIIGIRRIREKDINKLLKVTNASLVSDLTMINEEELGTGVIKVQKVGDEKLTLVKGKGKVRTILLMSSTKEKQEELEDNINKVLKIVSEEECVPGAGTAELILSKQMKKKLLGKEQLSYEAYAQALKEITKKLIKNSGQDITRELTKLKNGQGVGVKDPVKEGIIEPLKLKKQLINTATETAIMILRIDSIIKGK